MKEIKLTQGKVALVDDDVFEEVNKFKWCLIRQATKGRYNQTYYAIRHYKDENQKKRLQRMHRYIWYLKTGEMTKLDIDHINTNGLDNRLENLRLVTRSQNGENRRINKQPNKSSKYKGVTWRKRDEKWNVRISINNTRIHVGDFKNEEEAEHAYDRAALKIFTSFCNLNFPVETYMEKQG